MRIVFWQNILSPHQLPYIIRLTDDERVSEVVVVAAEGMSDERMKMGWQLGDYDMPAACRIVVSPDDKQGKALLEERQEESVHLFSGIHGFPQVFKFLTLSFNYNVRRGMITELPNTFAFGRKNGKPLWMHRLRFLLQDRKYAKKMDYVFAMGSRATKYFRSVHRGWKVFPFMYCTSPKSDAAAPVVETDTKFIFVGSLSYWKSPTAISSALSRCLQSNNSFNGKVTFVGDGALRAPMEAYVLEHSLSEHVHFHGFKPQNEVPTLMSQHDVLILPSIYDGWGAVVNEALQAGLYIIVSNACGASDLMVDRRIGQVFRNGNLKQLTDCMTYCASHIAEIRQQRAFRKEWADKHISGQVLAKYMIDCLSNVPASMPWVIPN